MKDQVKTSLHSTFEFIEQDQRFKNLEDKVFNKKRRREVTGAQRFLIMYYLKALDPIIQNELISQNTKDGQVAAILDIDRDNAKKYLSELAKKTKPLLHTKTNYEFLMNFFAKPGQEDILKQVERTLTNILKHRETL